VQRPRIEIADQSGAEHRDGMAAHGGTDYNAGTQEPRSTGAQEHRSPGTQELRNSGVKR
jgi:hypothetical protein